MAWETDIEWTGATWNPVTGCTKISKGCLNCYAERMAKRLAGRYGYDREDPFKVTLHPNRLDQPIGWRKKNNIFVCSMGDLFHEDVSDDFIVRVFNVMRSGCPPYISSFDQTFRTSEPNTPFHWKLA